MLVIEIFGCIEILKVIFFLFSFASNKTFSLTFWNILEHSKTFQQLLDPSGTF
jgi:hypothetical protein